VKVHPSDRIAATAFSKHLMTLVDTSAESIKTVGRPIVRLAFWSRRLVCCHGCHEIERSSTCPRQHARMVEGGRQRQHSAYGDPCACWFEPDGAAVSSRPTNRTPGVARERNPAETRGDGHSGA
jgi:hypothetical protein